jgi:hypothetical protein
MYDEEFEWVDDFMPTEGPTVKKLIDKLDEVREKIRIGEEREKIATILDLLINELRSL